MLTRIHLGSSQEIFKSLEPTNPCLSRHQLRSIAASLSNLRLTRHEMEEIAYYVLVSELPPNHETTLLVALSLLFRKVPGVK